MRKIKMSLLLVIVVTTILWLMADSLWPQPFTYFSFRKVFIQYTGVLTMAFMGIAMLLSLRWRWVEHCLGGLDKGYRLHKWLGIAALITATLHWWWAQGTKWMVGWGWLEKPVRHGGGQQQRTGFEQWFHDQRGLAESVGEWAFYIIAVLLLMALIKRVPYHYFRKFHRLIPVLYLAFIYHTVILLDSSYWSQAVGWFSGLLLLAGGWAAFVALTGKIAANKQVQGEVIECINYQQLKVMEMRIKLEPGWPGHSDGQFAFLTSDHLGGAHPFTIASSWQPESRCITLIIKVLGDHTRKLMNELKTGAQVKVEGPYGCFDFADRPQKQIWVGAGIGITPFIARMKKLAQTNEQVSVDLFHPTRDFQQEAIDKLKADAKAAGIRLHLITAEMDKRVDADMLCRTVKDWNDASIWFCGPQQFGQQLRSDMLKRGFSGKHFHQEMFEFR